MPSVYDLKPRFQALLRPVSNGLVRAGASPNAVTLAALAGSGSVGALVLAFGAQERRWLLLLPVWLFVRMALNAVDGMMAREHGMRSNLGAVLNEAGDVVADLALYLALAALQPNPWPVLLFALGGVLTELCGITMQALGGSRRYDGPMGKSDRALLVGAVALVAAFARPGRWLPALFWLAAALTVWCSIQRVRRGLAEIAAKTEAA